MKIIKWVGLIILTLGITFIFYVLNRDLPDENQQFLQDREWSFKREIKLQYRMRNEKIDTFSFFNCNDSMFLSLSDRLASNKQLVLFVPEEFCEECVTREYDNLRKLPADLQPYIMVVSAFSSIRNVKMWIQSKKIIYPVYNSKQLYQFELLNKSKQVALFVLDSTLLPQHLFLPSTLMPEMTLEYYDFIKSLFPNKDEKEFPTQKNTKVEANDYKKFLGDVTLNQTVTTTFELKNIGDCPLVIHKVNTACGCTVVQWDQHPVEKDKVASVTVKFTGQQAGFFAKKIFVFCNVEKNPIQLLISGKVK
ncbi:DUF1573 domain-containing protein [Parabacteroides pacaensis]|uniref:DUF1573 domain-containing protein n=1 Tax=Parabacteroides pacaensis TaxID=2086575 RepID=UPI00131B6A2E|nr:DUF1573 domain-containing protein [Parabacteroides pacaensis]